MSDSDRNINPSLRSRKRIHPSSTSTETYVEQILAGNRTFLSRAITLIESQQPRHQEQAQAILAACLPHSGKGIRIGITGSPGVGKSTFIEALGQMLLQEGKQVGVLAIDPSSPMSKGSILGDKTRMAKLSREEKAFIRPSPAGTSLGGVAQKTRETIILCEAAGFDHILLETVGVGQSEVAVHAMTDLFLLLLLPGAGDELQGIKRGIVEMADLLVINKAEAEREQLARDTQRAYRNALHLYPPKDSGWTPQVAAGSALNNTGMDKIRSLIHQYFEHLQKKDLLIRKRREQALFWFEETIDQQLKLFFQRDQAVQEAMTKIRQQVAKETLTPFQGAQKLLDIFLQKNT
ncbi:MAG TPA: methylmalonyl Co-A mutase-associated GTPase MeaB [Saprospiraceae bacterium]|nr:methylmalonyl Co-A mutase-associated GTPase MeaB [Saprospiraceae bacterium]